MVKITESTLSSPIILEEADELLLLLHGSHPDPLPGWQVPRRLLRIATSLPAECQSHINKLKVLRPDQYKIMFQLEGNATLSGRLLTACVTDAKVALSFYTDAVRSLWHKESGVNGSCTDMFDNVLSKSAPKALLDLFCKSSFWTSLETTASYCLVSKPLSWAKFEVHNCVGYVNGEFLVLCIKERWFLLTWDQVLMFKDASFSRFLAGCYSSFNPLAPEEGLSLDCLCSIIRWQEECISTHGNNGYGILKCLEPLFKTAIFQTSETLLEPDLLPYDNMLEKMRAKERKLSGKTLLIDSLNQLIVSIKSDKRALADGFGTLKLSGHPVVDPVAGVAKVKALATMEMRTTLESSRMLRRNFCHMYSKGFLTKHRRFPSIRYLQREGVMGSGKLVEIAQSPLPKLNTVADNYPLTDWDHVRFGHEYTLDEGEDFLSLVADRAISGKRSEIWETWKERLTSHVPKLTTSRRALLEVLTREEFNIGDVIRVVQDRSVDHDLYIVCIFPKEREMKPEPRVFAMLPLDMRTYFVNLESNLSKGIFRDVAEQTMTMSYSDLKKRFIELSKARNLPEAPYWTVHIELDLESWNVRMRKLVVDPIARDLDDLYGVADTFTFIHEFFENSLRILRHPAFPPGIEPTIGADPVPSEIAYGGGYGTEDHQGGEEGLFQKGWTLLTIAMIKWSLSSFGVDFELIGQADNQVVVAKLPKKRFPGRGEVSAFSRKVLAELDRVCALVGHSVKPEECIVATSGFSYGKELILDGATIPSTLKATSRMFPTRTTDSPTTSSCLAGVWSDGLAATEKTDLTPLSMFLTHLMSSMFLRREMNYSALHGAAVGVSFNWPLMDSSMKSELIQLLMHLPVQLGGLVPGNMCSFLYKGTADPLVQSLTSTVMLSSKFVQLQRVIGWLDSKVDMSKDPDITHLLEEPFSLPIRRAPDPLYALKKQVASKLDSINNNRVVQEVLDLSGHEGKTEFISWIGSLSPFFPKVYHDLYDASPYTEIDKFASRFTNTRTLIQKTGAEGLSTAGMILSSDLSYWTDTALRIKNILRSKPLLIRKQDVCAFAADLRLLWELGPLEGIGAACPLAVVTMFKSNGQLIKSSCDGVLVGVIEDCTGKNSRLTRGNIEPYLGGSTLPKKTDRGVHIIRASPPIRKAMTILQIRDIVASKGSKAWNDIGLWAQARTSLNLEWLEAATPKMFGGNVAHRYSTSSMPEGASLCSLINLSTRLQMSSDLSGKLGQSELDKQLSYQESFMLERSLISFLPEDELANQSTFVVELSLDNVPSVGSTLVPAQGERSPVPPTLPLNYYLKSDKITVSRKSESSLNWRGSRFVKPVELQTGQVSSRAVREAIRSLVDDALTKRREIQRSLENPNVVSVNHSIIDVPESKNLFWEEVVQSCALAAVDLTIYAAIRITPPFSTRTELGTSVFTLTALVGPAIYSSVANSLSYLKGKPVPGALPLIGFYQQKSAAASFSRAVSERARDIVQTLNPRSYRHVCRDGFSSSAGTESNIVFSNIVLWTISRDSRAPYMFRALREVCNIKSLAAKEHWNEDELLDAYDPVLTLMSVSGHPPIRVLRSSPQEALRQVRLRVTMDSGALDAANQRRNLRPLLPLTRGENWTTVGGDLLELLRPLEKRLPNTSEAVYRGMCRPLSVHSSAWYTWRPVLTLCPPVCAVLGVGVGGIVDLLNTAGIKVYGFEKRSVLLGSREHFPSYRPSLCTVPDLYVTHPISWLTSGDVTCNDFKREFCRWLRATSVKTVLIDIEGVSLEERLILANLILEEGLVAIVKLYLPGNIEPVLISLGSQFGSLDWWPNPADPSSEVVVVLRTPVLLPLRVPSGASSIDNLQDFCNEALCMTNQDLCMRSHEVHNSLVFLLFQEATSKPFWESESVFRTETSKLLLRFCGKKKNEYKTTALLIMIELVVKGDSDRCYQVSSHTLRLVSKLAGLVRLFAHW